MVWDISEDAWIGVGRVGGPSGKPGTGRRTLGEVLDGSGYHGEVRDGSVDNPGCPG